MVGNSSLGRNGIGGGVNGGRSNYIMSAEGGEDAKNSAALATHV